jgi:PRC-barrel domain protein
MHYPSRIYVIPALTLVLLGQIASASAWAQTGTDIDRVTLMADKSSAVVRHRQLESVLGKEVRTRVEQDVGRIVDVLTDRQGRPQAAVIEFGGFLGIGTRKIAVEWPALSFENDGKQPVAIVDMTRDQLRVAPEYKPNEPAVVRRASE